MTIVKSDYYTPKAFLLWYNRPMRIGKTIIAFTAVLCVAAALLFFASKTSIVALFGEKIDFFAMYQNLGNPYIRYVRIPAGLRKEEVADIYGKVLAWNDQDRKDFLNESDDTETDLEGYYFPSTYVLPMDASGEEVKDKMLQAFNKNVTTISQSGNYLLSKDKVNIDTALKIASLIQREAAGKQDMNLISGIIWNRIWNGMSLDIDATLQYAKGSEDKWWPVVLSADKQIASPYNTYKNTGLPPTPIASPGLAAIEAAYNPQKTACLFYFHDNDRVIHCSATYAEHKKGVEEYLR